MWRKVTDRFKWLKIKKKLVLKENGSRGGNINEELYGRDKWENKRIL